MSGVLYIFAGFPKSGLSAGGLQHAIETVEELGILEHDPAVQYRKEGVFIGENSDGEWTENVEYNVSDLCLRDGITWDWFPENWCFGNGANVHKSIAPVHYRTVVQETGGTLEEFKKANRGKPYKLSGLTFVEELWRHKGRREYETRWLPGTCPQVSHLVHLTWIITRYKLPPFAYERIRSLVEDVEHIPVQRDRFEDDHFAPVRVWKGVPL
jgi:hypothetical protein